MSWRAFCNRPFGDMVSLASLSKAARRTSHRDRHHEHSFDGLARQDIAKASRPGASRVQVPERASRPPRSLEGGRRRLGRSFCPSARACARTRRRQDQGWADRLWRSRHRCRARLRPLVGWRRDQCHGRPATRSPAALQRQPAAKARRCISRDARALLHGLRCLQARARERRQPRHPRDAAGLPADDVRSRDRGRQERLHGEARRRLSSRCSPGHRCEQGRDRKGAWCRRRYATPSQRCLQRDDPAHSRRRHRRDHVGALLLEHGLSLVPRSARRVERDGVAAAQLALLHLALG